MQILVEYQVGFFVQRIIKHLILFIILALPTLDNIAIPNSTIHHSKTTVTIEH